MKSTSHLAAAALLFGLTSAYAQPVTIKAPVGTVVNGAAGRVVVVPGVNAGLNIGGSAVYAPGAGMTGNAQFKRRSFGVQDVSAAAPYQGHGEILVGESPVQIQVTPNAVYTGANASLAGIQEFGVMSAASIAGGKFSPEKAQIDGGKVFDGNVYARNGKAPSPALRAPSPDGRGKAPKAPVAPKPGDKVVRPPKTVNPSGKNETTKGKLPIHRPEEGSSTYEPGLYSPSRISEFEWNKNDYILHWVFRTKRDVPKVIEAFMGGITHQAMEQVNIWLQGGKRAEQITLEDVLEVYHTLWDEQYVDKKWKLEEGFTVGDYRNRGEDFLKAMWSRYYPFNAGKTLFFERKMLFFIEEPGTGKRYKFQGIPDMIKLFEDENVIEISDYKTTLFPKTQDQLKKHDFQLALYVLAMRQNFPELVKGKKFRLKWNYKETFQTIDVTEEYLAEVVERVLTTIHEIEVAVEQAEANREEWEKRINPVAAPRKMADAQKMVDRWTKIHWKKETLARELKKLEDEEENLMSRLLAFAKSTGHTTISGRVKDVVLSEKESVKTPTKSEDPEQYAKLAKIIKEAGLWDQFSALDLNEIKKMAKIAGHPHHALYEKIKELVSISMKQDLKLKDKVEEKKKK